jgi:CDP-diacylglycerol--serine O-phosphatidyltransferase
MPVPSLVLPAPFHLDNLRAFEQRLGKGIRLHPHVISLTKLLLVLPIAAVLTAHELSAAGRALALAALFLAFSTLDYLDGLVAREQGLSSTLGRLVDRATDLPVLLLLSARSASELSSPPLALKLALDLLLLVLYARGFGSTKNRVRTVASYVSLFALLMIAQGWGAGLVTPALVDQLLWINAGISLVIVLRRLGILHKKRIADALSLANLACGLCSMSFAARGELAISLLLLSLGAGLDGLDGAAARRWGGSRFGVYMDDLADGVSYGLSPGYAIYATLHGQEGTFVGLAFACFVICRLAFFTLNKSSADPGVFRGVPSTVGGLITLSALFLFAHSPLAVGFLVGLGCALMVGFDAQHRHLGRALAAREARGFALAYVAILALGAALGGLRVAVLLVLASSLLYGFLPSLAAFRRIFAAKLEQPVTQQLEAMQDVGDQRVLNLPAVQHPEHL